MAACTKSCVFGPGKLTKRDLLFLLLLLLFFTTPMATAPSSIAGILFLTFWLMSGIWWQDRWYIIRQDWFLPLVIMLVLPWIALIWSPDRVTGLSIAKRSLCLVYGIAAASISYERFTPKLIIFSFLAGISVNVLVSIVQYLNFMPMFQEGYGFIYHIGYSLLLVVGMLFLVCLHYEYSVWQMRFALYIGIVVLLWNLAVNIGRSGYLVFLVALPWMLVRLFSRQRVYLIILVGVFALGGMALSPSVQSRVARIVKDVKLYQLGDGNTSVGARFHMWRGAFEVAKKYPLFGTGTGGYRYVLQNEKIVPEYINQFSHPHNNLLFIVVNYGVIGLIVFIWLIFAVLRRGWCNRYSVQGQIVIIVLYVVMVGGLTDTQIMTHSTAILMGIIIGLPATDKLSSDITSNSCQI